VSGEYDFTLRFHFAPGLSNSPEAALDDAGGLTIAEALEQQLGLQLTKTKAPLDVIVIDRAEKVPTEN
jgi:uncharacterized protein (TIGR03435 family)